MLSWLWGSSRLQNIDDKFINAIISNLIDTQDVQSNLYRVSDKQYFDDEKYPIPKMQYSPIWFSLDESSTKMYKGFRDQDKIVLEYNFKPNYKILKMRNDNVEMNKPLMKIIVDYVINKILNDEDKIQNIIDKIKNNDTVAPLTGTNSVGVNGRERIIFSDDEIINRVLNIFEGIYGDDRTGYKFIDELLFQEIINQMMRLNLIERYNIVGFWNGRTQSFAEYPTPEEIIIIANRMRECLTPVIKEQPQPIVLEQLTKTKFKEANISKPQETKIREKTKKNKTERQSKLNKLRTQVLNESSESSEIIGGKKNKSKNKSKK